MLSYHLYCLASPIDFVGGSTDYLGLPEILKADADRLVAALDRNPLGDTDWREDARFGWLPMPAEDLRLWAMRKLDNNGTTIVVSPLPLGYGPDELLDYMVIDPWE